MASGVLRCLMVTFNILFSVIGLAVLTTGIVLLVSRDTILTALKQVQIEQIMDGLNEGTLKIAAILLIVAGAMTFLLGFLGCCGALMENRCMLGLFFVLVLTMCLVELAAGIAAAVFKNDVTAEIKKIARNFFDDAMTDKTKTNSDLFHQFEKEFKCCGIDGVQDYNATTMPGEMCKYEPMTDDTPGCWNSFIEFIDTYVYILLGVGAGVAGLQIIGLVISMAICCSISKDSKY